MTVFLCVPSRFSVEIEINRLGVPPEPHCNEPHVVSEALPLLLAYHTGQFEVIQGAGLPKCHRVDHGGRAPSAISLQLVAYHALAVAQQQASASTVPHATAAPQSGGAAAGAGDGAADAGHREASLTAAVCIVGRVRSLADPEVYLSIAANVTGPTVGANASLFYVIDLGGRPLSDFEDVFRVLPPTALALVDGDNWGSPVLCKAYTLCGVACLFQFQKLRNCLHLVEAAERSRGYTFDWLVRIRPDTTWRAPIGYLSGFDARAIYMVMGPNRGDPEDNFALVPRAHAEVYFAIGEGCPTPWQTQRSQCAIPWYEGAHITPECALRTRLHRSNVPMASFPKIYQIKREAVCRPDDPRGCGQCSRGVCHYDYSR